MSQYPLTVSGAEERRLAVAPTAEGNDVSILFFLVVVQIKFKVFGYFYPRLFLVY